MRGSKRTGLPAWLQGLRLLMILARGSTSSTNFFRNSPDTAVTGLPVVSTATTASEASSGILASHVTGMMMIADGGNPLDEGNSGTNI